ncbi:hypothetical protein M5D96_003776 [Drosophila gunungcola]|uniref:Uncharacterized protein n=1 Tax=Drosophila gunungcola TaxID=103775 RepID=A0A9P9YT90_9MUSC|nr:hypothetical protein M5D96_003776 [Drosophila gunungcola]
MWITNFQKSLLFLSVHFMSYTLTPIPSVDQLTNERY